jgi:hypothetical protein
MNCTYFRDHLLVLLHTDVTLRTKERHGREKAIEPLRGVSSRLNIDCFALQTLHFVRRNKAMLDPQNIHVQSVAIPGEPLRLQSYTRPMALFGLMLFHSWNVPKPNSVCVLGLGGNVLGHFFANTLNPEAEIHTVEVEPVVLEMCRLHGMLDTQRVTCHIGDARDVLQRMNRRFDMIFVDCFDPQTGDMLYEEAFLRGTRAAINPAGTVLINIHSAPNKHVLSCFLRFFETVHALRFSDTAAAGQCIVACSIQSHSCPKSVKQMRDIALMLKDKYPLSVTSPKRSGALRIDGGTVRIWDT